MHPDLLPSTTGFDVAEFRKAVAFCCYSSEKLVLRCELSCSPNEQNLCCLLLAVNVALRSLRWHKHWNKMSNSRLLQHSDKAHSLHWKNFLLQKIASSKNLFFYTERDRLHGVFPPRVLLKRNVVSLPLRSEQPHSTERCEGTDSRV